MAADLDGLTRELAELRRRRDRLETALTESAAELRNSGAAPSSETLQSLHDYRTHFESVERLFLSDSELANSASGGTLDDWDQAIQIGKRRRNLATLLQDVRRLRMRGTDSPGPLLLAWNAAETAEAQLAGGDQELAAELLSNRHVLNALLTLVRDGDSLHDAVWTELQDQVSKHFGRDLSTAVARGKLHLDRATSLSVSEAMS